jgi:dienelactone hydrolase
VPDVAHLRRQVDALRPARAWDEAGVFRAALAVVMLSIADDAFIDRAPGVAVTDHLASGLVPLACAGLMIAGARRLPRLVLGWLAIFTGALAIVGGVADRATAVPAGAAGAVLLALGVATLWRTRRPTGRRLLRRAGIGAAVLVLVVLVVLPAGVAIVATHKARTPVAAVDLGRPHRDARLTTSDGLHLQATYVPSRNGAAVIVFPGRVKTVPPARMLIRHGYGVLILDRRGEGVSGGDYNAFGWAGEPDVRAAIAFLRRQPDVDPARIGGLGLSVGGELLLQTAAHTRALRAVVSEGAGQRSLAEHLDNPELGRVQRWFSGMLTQTAAVAVLSNGGPPASLADLVPRIAPRRVLLIEALNGNPDEVLNEVYARAAGAELWRVKAGGHTGALAAAPAEYEQRVAAFFDRALR